MLAWIECEIEAIHEAGDHEFVVGAVHELDVEREGGPLVFFRGGYANLGLSGPPGQRSAMSAVAPIASSRNAS